MANKRNLKVNLAEFEESSINNQATQQRSDLETQQLNNASMQKVDNADTQACNNSVTQERNDATTQRRKKSIPRSNGQTYYIEPRHKKALKMINACNDIDMQDVVRTALDIFLKKYMKEDGQGINEDGVAEVEKYIWEE